MGDDLYRHGRGEVHEGKMPFLDNPDYGETLQLNGGVVLLSGCKTLRAAVDYLKDGLVISVVFFMPKSVSQAGKM